MRTSIAALPRLLSLFAQFVTFCGFVVIVAGLAKLQKTTNALGPADQIPAATANLYVETFSNALLTPYPASHGFQFSFIWFIIFFQLLVLLLTLFITLVPGFFFAGRTATFTLLAVVMTLTINVVNNLVYFHRSDFAKTAYGSRDINVTLAGAFLVVLGNAFTILTLGFWNPVETAAPAYPATATATKREAEVPHTAV